MPSGLATTVRTLAKSHNDAATAVLAATLDGADARLVEAAVQALIGRRSKSGHLAVLRRWSHLTAEQRSACDEGRGRLGAALRDALVSQDDALFAAGAELALRFGEFELVATLIHVAEDQVSPHAVAAGRLALSLIDGLRDALRGETDGGSAGGLQAVRRTLQENAEHSLDRYRRHQRSEIVEAFLALARPDCPSLHKLLDSPHHPCFPALVRTLTESGRPSIGELLVGFLEAPSIPRVAAHALSKRTDPAFVALLLAAPNQAHPHVRRNLKQVVDLAFLRDVRRFVAEHPDPWQQAAAMRLLQASGASVGDRLHVVEGMLEVAAPAARAAAMPLLGSVPGDRANHLIQVGLQDVEPAVQAAAASLLATRPCPGALPRLVELLSSPFEPAAAAARAALADFSLENYLRRFDALDKNLREKSGELVLKVDAAAADKLRAELADLDRTRRLRAIRAAEAMRALPLIAAALTARLEDDDHLVRTAAASGLGGCEGDDVREALLGALHDRSAAVRAAAQASLRRVDQSAGDEPLSTCAKEQGAKEQGAEEQRAEEQRA